MSAVAESTCNYGSKFHTAERCGRECGQTSGWLLYLVEHELAEHRTGFETRPQEGGQSAKPTCHMADKTQTIRLGDTSVDDASKPFLYWQLSDRYNGHR